ncbi:MAG TPA: hypothetical protein VL335_02745 [Candidatus Paceibacterota bacterium]|jgi:hypothetical protein|nr:hypothetical protein [Candidatus Paceibacterota bacterium]
MKYGNREPWKRFFYSPASIGIALIMTVLIVRGAWNIHEKALLAEDRLDQAKAELADLQSQKTSLSASIDHLSTPAGMEAELREKYHAVKEGESVAVIIDPDADNATSGQSTTTPPISWWGKLLRMIGL